MATRKPRAPIERPSELRMSKVLDEQLKKKATYVALARAISAVNGLEKGNKEAIDRRKLKKIIDGDQDLVLTLAELNALDRYLEPLGEGLAYRSLFVRENVLQKIAEAGKPVTFLLGSKPVTPQPGSKPDVVSRLNLDHWDVNALAEVQRGVSNFAPDVRFDIRDVLLHEEIKDARRSIKRGKWTELLEKDGPSLVCLGSSRANHAAELMLARMFGIAPFEDSPENEAGLPFHFVWPTDLDHVFPSAFRYTAGNLADIHPKAARAIQDKAASALEQGGHVHLDRVKQGTAQEGYGVCVAQRRPGGQIWLVLAGVTGPATLAAARLAHRLDLHMRPAGPRKHHPVLWAPVRAHLGRDPNRSFGTFLTVEDQDLVSGPHSWFPA